MESDSPDAAEGDGADDPSQPILIEEDSGEETLQLARAGGQAGQFGGQADQAGGQGGYVPLELERRISALRGGGPSLPAPTRRFFERRFGRDFSAVRIHTGAEASMLAGALEARAFTLGADLFFADGAFAPDSDDGRRLLAHELTHVVQQGMASVLERADPVPVSATGGPIVQRLEGGAGGFFNGALSVAGSVFDTVGGWAHEALDSVSSFVSQSWNSASSFVSGAWDSVSQVATSGWNAISGFGSSIWSSIQGVGNTILQQLKDLGSTGISIVRGLGDQATDLLRGLGSSSIKLLGELGRAGLAGLRQLGGAGIDLVQGLKQAGVRLLNQVGHAGLGVLKALGADATSFARSLGAHAASVLNHLGHGGAALLRGLGVRGAGLLTRLVAAGFQALKTLGQAGAHLLKQLGSQAVQLLNRADRGAIKLLHALGDRAVDFARALGSKAMHIFGRLGSSGATLLEAIGTGAAKLLKGLSDAGLATLRRLGALGGDLLNALGKRVIGILNQLNDLGLKTLKHLGDSALTLLRALGKSALKLIDGLGAAAAGALRGLSAFAASALGRLQKLALPFLKAFKDKAGAVLEALGSQGLPLLKRLGSKAISILNGLGDRILSFPLLALQSAVDAVDAADEGEAMKLTEEQRHTKGFREFAAHTLAYRDDFEDPALVDRLAEEHYLPPTSKDIVKGGDGLFVVRLRPDPVGEAMGLPVIIAPRGTDGTKDLISDLGPHVGVSQFLPHQDEIEDLVRSAGGPVVLVGHSLGGALAQMIAVALPGQVQTVETFQSTGISAEAVKRFRAANQDGHIQVDHNAVGFDGVNDVGEQKLDGTHYYHEIDGLIFLRDELELHGARMYDAADKNYMYRDEGGKPRQVTSTVLDHDPAKLRFPLETLRQVVGIGTVVPFMNGVTAAF